MSLISKEELKALLSQKIPGLKELKIASAYATDHGIEWLNSLLPESAQIYLIVRGRPNDFLSGASSISALSEALRSGWKVYVNQELHAKIYLLDDYDCFVGSSNLTANGLILSAQGNIEANFHFKASDEAIDFYSKVLKNSKEIDSTSISKMIDALEVYSVEETKEIVAPSFWDSSVLKEEVKEIFTIDFPLKPIGENSDVDNRFSEIDNKIKTLRYREARALFKQTRVYQWILEKLRAAGSLHFGSLSKLIHDSLCDDPTPYRKEIKSLQSNLLMYFEALSDEVVISRPNHSQLIEIKDKKNKR